MSYAYQQRKKTIKRWRRDNPTKLLHGQIRPDDFAKLRHEWRRRIDGPPIGTLADLHLYTGRSD